ncbi:hypothetical protein BV882_07995 [Streptomyces sp. 46]|nr:hypothetical protein BV882_07995 [Streptomyces sp. 46]
MLSCVGHRVMVPPSAGTRPVGRARRRRRSGRRHWNCILFAFNDLYKEWPRTHRHRLWCPDGLWEKLTAYKGTSSAVSRRTRRPA